MASDTGGEAGQGAGRPLGGTAAQEAEIARLRAQVAALQQPRHRLRSFFAAVFIVLAWILAPLSVVAAWTSSIVGDTNRYVHTVAPLARNPDIQAAVASRVSSAVSKNLDLGSLIQQYAPADRPRLEKLLTAAAGPIEGAITSFVHEQTLNVVSSDWFAQFWDNANRAAHASVDNVLTGKNSGAVQVKAAR